MCTAGSRRSWARSLSSPAGLQVQCEVKWIVCCPGFIPCGGKAWAAGVSRKPGSGGEHRFLRRHSSFLHVWQTLWIHKRRMEPAAEVPGTGKVRINGKLSLCMHSPQQPAKGDNRLEISSHSSYDLGPQSYPVAWVQHVWLRRYKFTTLGVHCSAGTVTMEQQTVPAQ